MHNKNLNFLLNLLSNTISAKSASPILSIKDECVFLISNFPILVYVILYLIIY